MLRNYFKIALRNLQRNKVFSAINIAGLAIGLAACLIILLFVQNELSYDRFNQKADRMVRVVFRGTIQGEKMSESNVMPPVATTLQRNFPEVQEVTRFNNAGGSVVKYQEKIFQEDKIAFADSNFFQVFTLPLLAGDVHKVLLHPGTMVITRSIARKYFGQDNPIGKSLHFENGNADYTITGIIDKVPDNSHFHFDFFLSMASLPDASSTSWLTSNYFTYLVLRPGYDYHQLEAKLPRVMDKYASPQLLQAMGMTTEQFRQKGNNIGLYLQPLTSIHLHSDSTNELEPGGNIQYVYIFSAIAAFMLLIACINFMNLSTAGASRRAREVGIRKVLGSRKIELVRQFLLESTLLAGISLVLAIGLVYLTLPLFNTLSGKQLEFRLTATPWLMPALVLFGLLTGILAGTYPAFFLSSFQPVSVLKGKLTTGRNTLGLRSSLVVFQFFVAIALMICTGVVYNQLSYIQHKKLGYDKDQVLILQNAYRLGPKQGAFAQQIRQDSRVADLSISGYLPAGPTDGNNFFVYPEGNYTQLVKTLRYDVDENYIPTLGMQLASGRNFSHSFGTDSSAAILNETAAKALGWGDNPLGHSITNTDNQGHKYTYRVVGVVKDFHFRSMHERIAPLVMTLNNDPGRIIIKTTGKDIPGLLASLKKEWTSFTSETPFDYSFLDEDFMATYKSELTTGQILAIFAGLTIFVACLGLFGLAAFTAEQRTKEIGIRKVLGATVTDIITLLSKDFLKLVALSALIAFPLSGWLMHQWLRGFAYPISIGWTIFADSALLGMGIALVTISYQAIKAAISNPVTNINQ